MIDPHCNNLGTSDCFAKLNGKCKVLTSTTFKHRRDNRCPFYKSKRLYQEENEKIKERLIKLGKVQTEW